MNPITMRRLAPSSRVLSRLHLTQITQPSHLSAATTPSLTRHYAKPATTSNNRNRSSISSSSADDDAAAQRAARMHRAAGEEEDAQRRREAERAYQARYKSAARRWVSSVVALPILLVTSYYLFDRLVMGHEKKELPWKKPKSDGQ
ncbi:hypothetical protein K4F52_006147 [Lecanicillium sp. MT-2017a]|nr:hypothetical protein K4F52_006147 [Lecanicillium sp. MT-2017a]